MWEQNQLPPFDEAVVGSGQYLRTGGKLLRTFVEQDKPSLRALFESAI